MEKIIVNAEEVSAFLKKIKDDNDIHKEPHKVLPGMFGLYLLERQVKRPISNIKIDFKDIAKYPCELGVELEEGESETAFKILHKEEEIYSGLVGFDDEDDLNLNPFKFFSIYRVGGELLRHSESYFKDDETGIYLSQEMEFYRGKNPLDGVLKFGDMSGDRKARVIPLEYRLKEKTMAKGISKVRPITKKLLERKFSR